MEDKFKTYLHEMLASAKLTENNVITRICMHGWLEVGEQSYYFREGLAIAGYEIESRMHLVINEDKASEFFQMFMQTAPYEIVIILLLYQLWSYVAGFYQSICTDGGCRSLLYLAGETGSGKTSLVKILVAWQECCGISAEKRFDDTPASLEEGILANYDALTLVDDFYPLATKTERAGFKSKADAIARIIGDGCVKGKMGPDRKPVAERKYRGGIIATGEYIDLGTHSSYLRSIILWLRKGAVNFSIIAKLQHDNSLAHAFISGWIGWVEKNQNFLRKAWPCWQEEHKQLLQNCSNFEYARLNVSFATLLTISATFSEFAKQYGMAYEHENAKIAIVNLAEAMRKQATSVSPERYAARIIREAVENGGLRIARSLEEFSHDAAADGYRINEAAIWLISTKLQNYVTEYANSHGYGLVFNANLKAALFKMGFLNKMESAKLQRKRVVSPERPRGYTINFKEEF